MPTRLWSLTSTTNDDFLIGGTGDSTVSGDTGDDFILGDSRQPFTYGTTTIKTSPASLDSPLYWSTTENPFFGDASIPHTSLYVVADAGAMHYASVTIGAGETITVDIDFGYAGSIGVSTDTIVALLDSVGTQVASSDDSVIASGDAGSTDTLGGGGLARGSFDSYLTFTNMSGSTQTYTIVFKEFTDGAGTEAFDGGETFIANISVTGHAFSAFTTGNDVLNGDDGNDTLAGAAGRDSLFGGAGDDDLYGGSGDDTLNGGTGTDRAWYTDATSGVVINLGQSGAQNTVGAGRDTFVSIEALAGSPFRDTLIGSSAANQISGGQGDDVVAGYAGNDDLEGGDGNDVLIGGSGNDTLVAESEIDLAKGANSLFGDAGNDVLRGWFGNDTLSGGDGDDTIFDPGGDDSIDGGDGIDELSYVQASGVGVTVDLTVGSAQNTVGAGIDTITGIENLIGSGSDDTLTGDAAANEITGGLGSDSVDGGAGDDLLRPGFGNDTIIGGTGIDTVSYSDVFLGVTVSLSITAPQDTVGAGTDTIASTAENLIGSNFSDTLTGDSGANRIDGGAGDDILNGRTGDDTLIGGAGFDTASYAGASSAVTVSLLVAGAQNTGGGGTDTLTQIERLTGSSFNDTLTGNTGGNQLDGGAGADQLIGGAGPDTYVVDNAGDAVTEGLNAGTDTVLSSISYTLGANVERLTLTGSANRNAAGNSLDNLLIGNSGANVINGGTGNDTLTGGDGNDRFLFDTAPNSSTNVDHVTDFTSADDAFELDNDVFAITGPLGTISAAAYYDGTSAHDPDDRIIYDSTSGKIYYDADGTGAGAQILFVVVEAGLILTRSDFQIVG